MTSAPPIGFEYRSSRLLMAALAGMALLAMVAVLASALWWPLAALLVAAIVAAAVISLVRLQHPRVCSVLWRADGGMRLRVRGRNGGVPRELEGSLRAAHAAGPLVTLQLRWPGSGGETLWLLPDNLDPDTRRRLRVRLRAMVV